MKRIFCIPIIVLTLLCACDEDSNMNRDSIEYFQSFLKPDMDYKRLKSVFGEPDGDTGSGIHIYFYDLDDGTKVIIGFTDKILYARHVDQDHQLLDELI